MLFRAVRTIISAPVKIVSASTRQHPKPSEFRTLINLIALIAVLVALFVQLDKYEPSYTPPPDQNHTTTTATYSP